MQGLKSAILAFFGEGWDGLVLIIQPSIISCWISRIIFVFGFYEFLAIKEGKIRIGLFMVRFGKIKVCMDIDIVPFFEDGTKMKMRFITSFDFRKSPRLKSKSASFKKCGKQRRLKKLKKSRIW